jgi:CDP-glucose 4,6-dehydratase
VNGRLESYNDVERALNNHEIDSVFHLGAQAIVGVAQRSPRHTFETNIQGTWNILDACRAVHPMVKRIVVASSDKAYGTQEVLPYREEMSMNGEHPYEVSKSCADLISVTYAKTYNVPVSIARCGNIYGGGDLNWNRIVPGTLRSLIKGVQPLIRSDGTFIRDYIFVEDVVVGYLLLGEATSETSYLGEAFNFSNEEPLSVMDLYTAICSAVGMTKVRPQILNHAVGEIKDQYLDATKAHQELGWFARVELETGLNQTYQWYREFLSR